MGLDIAGGGRQHTPQAIAIAYLAECTTAQSHTGIEPAISCLQPVLRHASASRRQITGKSYLCRTAHPQILNNISLGILIYDVGIY